MFTPVPEVPRLQAVDVNDPGLSAAQHKEILEELTRVHARHFPAYTYVTDELAEGLEFPHTLVHPWLLYVDGEPVGEFLFHICLRRGIVQIHYVAMDEHPREELPKGWLASLTDAVLATSCAEAAPLGVDLLGMAGEMYCTPFDYRRWRRKGFLILALDYREPVAGRDWARNPDAFNRLTIGLRLTDAGRAADPEHVLNQVLTAFLLDYYGLPAQHPEVQRMFDDAHALRLTELSDEVINAR